MSIPELGPLPSGRPEPTRDPAPVRNTITDVNGQLTNSLTAVVNELEISKKHRRPS